MTEPETTRLPRGDLSMAEEMVAFVRAHGEEPQGENGQPTLGQVLALQQAEQLRADEFWDELAAL